MKYIDKSKYKVQKESFSEYQEFREYLKNRFHDGNENNIKICVGCGSIDENNYKESEYTSPYYIAFLKMLKDNGISENNN